MNGELHPALQLLLGVGVVVALIAALYLSYVQAKKRRLALSGLARELGWSFNSEKDRDLDGLRFGLFDRGRSRAAFNTLQGVMEIGGRRYQARMGDYTFTEGSGKHQRTYRLSYALITLPFPFVPDLDIRSENILDKVAGAIGFDDIDFESAEFSDKFHVKSPDKRFAYNVIHARMMEFLLKVEAPAIQIRDRDVLLTDGAGRWDTDAFRRKLWWAREFFELWPSHVIDQLQLNRLLK